MRLVRTSFAFDETNAYIESTQKNSLVESYFVQYLLIAFYSEVEEHVKKIISKRLDEVQDRKVASFIFKSNEGMLRRVKKAEINDVLQKFDCGEGDVISGLVGEMNLQPYFDAITNRHMVSHRDGVSMTLEDFAKALPCAEAILNALELALANE
jgi:hypothetical protein